MPIYIRLLALLSLCSGAHAIRAEPELAVIELLRAACDGHIGSLPLQAKGDPETVRSHGRQLGTRQRYTDRENSLVTITRIAPQDRLRSLSVEISDAAQRPEWFAASDQSCAPTAIRRIVWEGELAVELVHLDAATAVEARREPLNPPVPPGSDPGGVRVGLIDSGVNYSLASIASRLARDTDGRIVGYDFWDLDDRPFDSNPARSAFFPQRHGTRTASLLLIEGPQVALVPYRYPRPDMTRMTDLIEHAAKNDVRILAMPLGSRREEEWGAFEQAARAHPELLFIVSAGNEGRNIDLYPLHPASFRLANMIVVTSADQWGRPAERTNWGPVSVDLMVPAEQRRTQEFDGTWTRVSGSSYAVARVAALAARLAAQHPDWRAARLKRAIFGRASAKGTTTDVLIGLLADPLAGEDEVSVSDRRMLDLPQSGSGAVALSLELAQFEGAGWQAQRIQAMVADAAEILAQCAIVIEQARLSRVQVSERLLDFDAATAKTVVDGTGLAAPTIYLVRDTLRHPAFEAEAFGVDNTPVQSWLRHTVWMTVSVHDSGIALAHELFHVLSNDGAHHQAEDNLMHKRTSPDARRLTDEQCARARSVIAEQQLQAKP